MNMQLSPSSFSQQVFFSFSDVLDEPIEYAYCPDKKEWFWSADGINWQHAGEFLVYTGNKPKRPQPEDEDILRRVTTLGEAERKTFMESLLGTSNMDEWRCPICM